MNVFVTDLNVPKRYRNGRIYGGNSFRSTNIFNSGGTGIHIEASKITDLTDRHVVVEFATSFEIKPTCMSLKVYRMTENTPIAGKFVKHDVLHYFDDDDDWVTLGGFTLFIDEVEDLTGVIIEYSFI